MTEIKRYRCDCGCGTDTNEYGLSGWFTVSQPEADHNNKPHLYRAKMLYFVNLEHLLVWAKKAAPIAKRLESAWATSPHPRGLHVNEEVSLCI